MTLSRFHGGTIQMRLSLIAGSALTLLLSVPVLADEALRSAIADPDRPAAQAERDSARNPYETLTFFGLKPDMVVVEISPSGGWYTEILGPYLKDQGRLIAAHWDLEGENVPDFYRRIRGQFEERVADTDRFGEVQIVPFAPPEKVDLGAPGSADLVLTFRNVHGYKRAGTFGDVLDAAHAVLKPGGVLGVVSHRLPEDRDQDPDARSGYVKQSWVVAMAESHGFGLEEASEINANPLDTADHPSGVWSLPPGLRDGEETADRFRAIGESDRFTLKFVKR
jgi:predicted methyltransferase